MTDLERITTDFVYETVTDSPAPTPRQRGKGKKDAA